MKIICVKSIIKAIVILPRI